jgi:hypothetical protein
MPDPSQPAGAPIADPALRIGVISDTHGFLDPRVESLFRGVGHILHAGDIGFPSLLLELGEIGPVTAVGGNTDEPGLYQETAVVELAGRKFLVHHIVDPRAPAPALERRLRREQPDVVVFGHTHQAFCRTLGTTLYFNPGYAGKPRFNQQRSVGILTCGAEVRVEYLPL